MRDYNHTVGEYQRWGVRIVLISQLGQCPKVIVYSKALGELGTHMKWVVMACIMVWIMDFGIPKGFQRMELQLNLTYNIVLCELYENLREFRDFKQADTAAICNWFPLVYFEVEISRPTPLLILPESKEHAPRIKQKITYQLHVLQLTMAKRRRVRN